MTPQMDSQPLAGDGAAQASLGGRQPRFSPRWLSIAVAGPLLLSCGWLACATWQNAAAQSSGEKPVAMVGNELLYEKDYLPPLQAQVQKIRMAEYDLKRKALEAAINKRLVQAEAAKRGMKEEELLHQEADSRVVEPDESEVEQVWLAQMFQAGQLRESKDKIREQLKQELVEEARDSFFRRLREQAGVKIYLLPPAMDVGFDPSRVRGNPGAKITIVEFSDFHCPFCRQAYSTVKNLLQKYDGKIRVAYRDLPLQEVQSNVSAAEASRCAGDQGEFWPYHDLLFENQGEYGPAGFRTFAESLNLNMQQFGECLESGKYKAQVREDFQEAIRLGAVGTPYFFINGVPLNGARPQQDFEALIEAQLAALPQ